jgi:hypothetical protein
VKCFSTKIKDREETRKLLKATLIEYKEESINKWTKYILTETEHTLNEVLYGSFGTEDDESLIVIYKELDKILSTLIVSTCPFIYDITLENAKQVAPRAVSCYWIYKNLDNIDCMIIIATFIYAKINNNQVPVCVLRMSDIMHRFKSILVPCLDSYYVTLRDILKERDVELVAIIEEKK